MAPQTLRLKNQSKIESEMFSLLVTNEIFIFLESMKNPRNSILCLGNKTDLPLNRKPQPAK